PPAPAAPAPAATARRPRRNPAAPAPAAAHGGSRAAPAPPAVVPVLRPRLPPCRLLPPARHRNGPATGRAGGDGYNGAPAARRPRRRRGRARRDAPSTPPGPTPMTASNWLHEQFEPTGSSIGFRVTRKLDEVQSPF